MSKPGKDFKEPVEALIGPPYVAITRIGEQDFLLFDSRIEFDLTRTLRIVELSLFNTGVFVIEPASEEGSVHSFRISFWPQSATTQENILELAVVTVDFNAEPLHFSEQHPDTKPGAQPADLFLQVLRNRALTALCDVIRTAGEQARLPAASSDRTELPTQTAPLYYLAPAIEKENGVNRPSVEPRGTWIGGIVAIFIATAFLLALIAYSIY